MSKKKYRVDILANENPSDHESWIKACSKKPSIIEFGVIQLTKNTWYEEVIEAKSDCFLTKPPPYTAAFKQLYDERIWIIDKILRRFIYPSLEEILIYENKRLLSYWLKANQVPHPETHIFYFAEEACQFIDNSEFPLMAKVNIGASGSGVMILNNKTDARQYIKRVFFGKGAKIRWGPNLRTGAILKRGMRYVRHPKEISEKMNIYTHRLRDQQKDFVIFQEFIPHEYEWRCVRIGNSFFAHKKIVKGKKASGSLIKDYKNPPLSLLDYVETITDKRNFYSQAVDIFETKKRGYLVNEMQCFFGQSDPYQMLVDGKPGRYIKKKGTWVFEEGMFNANQSYDLRLDHVIELLETKQK
jgi:glutathione synthase/RimK-type ligase-like ATP-grasp enzyme